MPAGLVPIETNQRRPPFAEPEHPDHDLGGHVIIRGKMDRQPVNDLMLGILLTRVPQFNRHLRESRW
jgi:hypothetical protein